MPSKYNCNMQSSDSYIRFFIAFLVLSYSIYSSNFYLLAISGIMFFTAYTKFCFVYYLFHINKKLQLESFYLKVLPKNNPSPVVIFDYDGAVLFQNNAARDSILCHHSILDLSMEQHQKLIDEDTLQSIIFEYKDKTYKIQVQGLSKKNFLLAYFTDVTEIIQLNDEIEETQREIIYAMGEIGETRSKETGNHVKRVAKYSELLALLYGLPKKEADILKMASPMHDIGKVGIPDAVLNAPRKLNQEEWLVMQTHSELGYEMLKNSHKPILQAAAIVANEHHEKWDGSGYPNATSGEDIHIYGRITAIADVFDALGSERVYKEAWELEKILTLFKEERAKHFDPNLIDLFLNNLEKFLAIRDEFQDIQAA